MNFQNQKRNFYQVLILATFMAGTLAAPADENQPVPSTATYGRVTLTDFTLNGNGNQVTVAPGEIVHVSTEYTHRCHGCRYSVLNQTIIGIVGQEQAQACIDHRGIVGEKSGQSTNLTLTAPQEPGTYYVRFRYAQHYDCPKALKWWKISGGPPPSDANIGIIHVAEPTLRHLTSWLALNREQRPLLETQEFSTKPLTMEEAIQAQELLWQDHTNYIKETRRVEVEEKAISLLSHTLQFEYKEFGEKPQNGWSLYISLHGGGNTSSEINDRQWRNQISLYQPQEGIYLAPRAPTNTWNLWHQAHIDKLFDRLIEDMIVLKGVNPNRVYVMGYSAGGDGVYQLAPRMADRWAAAAMMAGHPNDASPLGLRNIGFTIHVGERDTGYNRSKIAEEWKKRLDDLHKDDPQGYKHEVHIHKGLPHWMNLQDKVAVEWMANFTRNPLPDKIVWKQDNVTHSRFYWLATKEQKPKAEIEVIRQGQEIRINNVTNVDSVTILLNDKMLDMNNLVTVKLNGNSIFHGIVPRTILTLERTLRERGDPKLIFSGEVMVQVQ